MRIFNLNAPAVFSGPVWGRSASVPSHFNQNKGCSTLLPFLLYSNVSRNFFTMEATPLVDLFSTMDCSGYT